MATQTFFCIWIYEYYIKVKYKEIKIMGKYLAEIGHMCLHFHPLFLIWNVQPPSNSWIRIRFQLQIFHLTHQPPQQNNIPLHIWLNCQIKIPRFPRLLKGCCIIASHFLYPKVNRVILFLIRTFPSGII